MINRDVIPLLTLITIVDERAAYAVRHYVFTELTLFIFGEYILLLALTACIITLAGEAMGNKEIAILAFIGVNVVILFTGEAGIRAGASNAVAEY